MTVCEEPPSVPVSVSLSLSLSLSLSCVLFSVMYRIEYAPHTRSRCHTCGQVMVEGEIRVTTGVQHWYAIQQYAANKAAVAICVHMSVGMWRFHR